MKNEDIIKEILYISIAVFIAIIVVKVALWLLPIILIGILAYYIYKKIIVSKNTKKDDDKIIDVKYKEKGDK